MTPLDIAGLVTAGGNLGLGVWNAIAGQKIADENLQLQRDTLAYQKDLQNTMFAREDNAVQRRAADLKAAGLSKTLAAGGAAQSGPVVATQAPQRGKEGMEGIGALSNSLTSALAGIATTTDISKTKADTALALAQAEKLKADTLGKNIENSYADRLNSQQLLLGAASLESSKISQANAVLDGQIKRFNISLQDIDKARAQVALQAGEIGLDQQRQDIVAKVIAIENARDNQEYLSRIGLPMGQSLSPELQRSAVVDKWFKDLFNKPKSSGKAPSGRPW